MIVPELDFSALRELAPEAMEMLDLRSQGFEPREIGEMLGLPDRTVRRRLEDLEALARRQLNRFPPLADEEYQDLKDDIARHGVRIPIVVDEDGVVLDGFHRQKAARELGVECPRIVREGLSDAEKRALSMALNLHRRHLSREARRRLLEAELRSDPERSDRELARTAGVDHKTVAAARQELEEGGEIPHVPERRGKDMKLYPIKKKDVTVTLSTRRAPGRTTVPETPLALVPRGSLSLSPTMAQLAKWQERAETMGLSLHAWALKALDEAAA